MSICAHREYMNIYTQFFGQKGAAIFMYHVICRHCGADLSKHLELCLFLKYLIILGSVSDLFALYISNLLKTQFIIKKINLTREIQTLIIY